VAEITIRITDKALKIAAAVVVGIVLVAAGSISWSSGAFRPRYELQMFVPEADGLRIGNQVRLNGMPVGSISKIKPAEHPQDASRGIQVTLRIEKQYQNWIVSDSTARLERVAILDGRIVNIQRAMSGQPIASGGEIRFTPTHEPTALEFIDALSKRFNCKGEENNPPQDKPHPTNF
jgi:ABC-type transporter Mla subunit MlaD